MKESKLAAQIREALSSAKMAKSASAEEADKLVTGAEEGVKKETVTSPAAGQAGVVEGIVKAEITGPGENSNVTDAKPVVTEDNIGATSGSNDLIDADPAKQLGATKEEITKEDLDMIDKAASALFNIAEQLNKATLAEAFEKKASEEVSPEALLQKMASEGNAGAQFACDFIASYNLGLAKKAADMEAIIGDNADPATVAAAEEALNQGAIEDPASLEDVEEGCEGGECDGESCEGKECEDKEGVEGNALDNLSEEDLAALQEAAAEVEGEAQQAVIEIAQAIQEQDPSIGDEEALAAAQEQVVDAIQAVDAQQALGATDEAGEYVIPDAAAEDAVGEMIKSASAFPLRDHLCSKFNERLGLNPQAFADRITR